MGRDARTRAFYVDLGPGVDPYRTPLGGRNFEYNTGEDPFLGGQLVAPLISAMQEQQVWADVKHVWPPVFQPLDLAVPSLSPSDRSSN